MFNDSKVKIYLQKNIMNDKWRIRITSPCPPKNLIARWRQPNVRYDPDRDTIRSQYIEFERCKSRKNSSDGFNKHIQDIQRVGIAYAKKMSRSTIFTVRFPTFVTKLPQILRSTKSHRSQYDEISNEVLEHIRFRKPQQMEFRCWIGRNG